MKLKLLFVVLDGMGDSGKNTPLKAADTPNMDLLAKKGRTGLVNVLGGIAPESDEAVMTLLGYDAKKYYSGRGPLEAYGNGIQFKPGMLGIRCNFATTTNDIDIVDRRAKRSLTSEEAKVLAAAVQKKVKLKSAGGADFIFRAGLAHRAVLVIKSKHEKQKLSKDISNTDPAYGFKHGLPEALKTFEMKVSPCKPLKNSASSMLKSSTQKTMQLNAQLSADLVNEFTEKAFGVLNAHPVNENRRKKGLLPANLILCRDAGNKLPDLPGIKGSWAILADMPLEVGIARLAGMSVVSLPLPTLTPADYGLRVRKAIDAAEKYQALYIHLKGPDSFGHDGDFNGKKKSIEDIDKYFFGPMLEKFSPSEVSWAVTADHCTPCSIKAHSGEKVPLLVAGPSVYADAVKAYSEADCTKGDIGTIKGYELMPILLKTAGIK